MSHTYRFFSFLGLSAALLSFAGCGGNPTCVFTSGCNTTTGAGSEPATLPLQGMFIVDTRPTVLRAFPDGVVVQDTAPVALVFSESMSSASLQNAIEVVVDTGFGELPVMIGNTALVGDGRVLLLFPLVPLQAGTVNVRLADGAVVTDITGQRLSVQPGEPLAAFSVDSASNTDPEVLGTWPADGDVSTSDVGELVVVFDRPMRQASVTDASFVVEVDMVAPTPDPPATPLMSSIFGGFGSETRVFLYRNEDTDGVVTPFTVGGVLDLVLSPMGSPIEDSTLERNELMTTTVSFTINDLATATGSRLISMPTDAIGLANLTAGDPMEFELEVDLADGMIGDWVDLFLFGVSSDPDNQQLIALGRSVQLVDIGMLPIPTATFTLADANLTPAGATIQPRFLDGRLAMALRVRRGSVTTPLQVLDVDPSTSGLQDAELDTVPPTIAELLHEDTLAGVSDTFRSDQREAIFIGESDENLSRIEVTLTLTPGMTMTSNGMNPAIGESDSTLFISAPAVVDPTGMSGILATGTANYSLVPLDRALNAGPALTGVFRQVGVVGTTALNPGDPVEVEVYDALTLEPLPAATVFTHADAGDGINFPFLSKVAAGSDGIASGLTSHMFGQAATIVTVDLTGYDLFTYHGIPTTRISVPLMPTGLGAPAAVGGSVTSTSILSQITLPLSTVYLADERSDPEADTFFATTPCVFSPFLGTVVCAFGPRPILPERVGAQSLLAGNFILTEPQFSAGDLIVAFDLAIPLPATADAALDTVNVQIPYLLDSVDGAPLDELPLALPLLALDTQGLGLSGIDLGNLAGDASTTGDPRVRIEGLVPGMRRPTPVGLGLAYDQGGGQWRIRSAIPGAVAPMGFLDQNGTVDPDLFVRAELRDTDGAISVRRERFSNLGGLPTVLGVPGLVAASAAALISPVPLSTVTGPSYEIVFDDVLPDGFTGLYKVRLDEGNGGRKWHLWRTNQDGGANVVMHLPDIEMDGGVALAAGPLTCEIDAWAWTGFASTAFLWSDVERLYEVHTGSVVFDYTQN